MESYLGTFRVLDSGERTSNDLTTRTIMVETDGVIYEVEFDPVQDLQRYEARIRMYNAERSVLDTIVLADDHLTNHLKKVHQNNKDNKLDAFFTIENSYIISECILNLRNRARYKLLSMVAMS